MENQPIINSSDTSPVDAAPVVQSSVPSQTKTNLMVPVLVTLLVSSVLFGFGGYYLGKQSFVNKPQNLLNQNQTEVTPSVSSSPTSVATSPMPDFTSGWKTYSSTILSFKYPQNLTLEERQKDFMVLLSDANNPQSVLISIDARQTGNYANYEKAVSSTKAGLTSIQSEEISNGTKISGKVGPGYGEGQQIAIALFKNGTAAIEAETTTTDANQLQIFNQILSTFKFAN